jgi:hypothetical protein
MERIMREASLIVSGRVNIIESRGCGVGTVCLDFVTYLKQDSLALRD